MFNILVFRNCVIINTMVTKNEPFNYGFDGGKREWTRSTKEGEVKSSEDWGLWNGDNAGFMDVLIGWYKKHFAACFIQWLILQWSYIIVAFMISWYRYNICPVRLHYC